VLETPVGQVARDFIRRFNDVVDNAEKVISRKKGLHDKLQSPPIVRYTLAIGMNQ
jgi:hypothetical protein